MILGVAELNDGPLYRGCPRGPYSYSPGQLNYQCDAFHFWSLHPGSGANFLFCDASVPSIPYPAAPLMPALAPRAGGEVVAIDFCPGGLSPSAGPNCPLSPQRIVHAVI